jgi:hypothetical protein
MLITVMLASVAAAIAFAIARQAANEAHTNGSRLATDGALRDARGALGRAESQLLANPDAVLSGVLSGERQRVCDVAPSTTAAPGASWSSECSSWTYTDTASTGLTRFEVQTPNPSDPALKVNVLSRRGGLDAGYTGRYVLGGAGRWVWASVGAANLSTASPSQTASIAGSLYATGAVSPNVGSGGVTISDLVAASESAYSASPTDATQTWYGPGQNDVRTVQTSPISQNTLSASAALAWDVACRVQSPQNISTSGYSSGLCFTGGAALPTRTSGDATTPKNTKSYLVLLADGYVRVYSTSRSIDTSATSALLCSSCSLQSHAQTLFDSSSHPGEESFWTTSGGALLGDFNLPANGVIAFDGDVEVGVCSDSGDQYAKGRGCQAVLGAPEAGMLARQNVTIVAGSTDSPKSLIIGSPLRANPNVQVGLVASDQVVLPYWMRPAGSQSYIDAHVLAAGLGDVSRGSVAAFPSTLSYSGANDTNWASRAIFTGSVNGVNLPVGITGFRDVVYRASEASTTLGGPPWFGGTDPSWTKVSVGRLSGVQSCGTRTCGDLSVPDEQQAPPAVPYSVSCVPSQSSVTCVWSVGSAAAAGPTTGFTLYLDGVSRATTALEVTSATVTGLSPGTTYQLIVAATGPGGETQSGVYSFTTAPSCPVVTATPLNGSSSTVNLSWTTPTSATSYKVYVNGATTPAYSGNATSYTDSAGSANQTRSYVVTALNASGESVGCTATTAVTGPGTPTLGALTVTGTGYSATWSGGVWSFDMGVRSDARWYWGGSHRVHRYCRSHVRRRGRRCAVPVPGQGCERERYGRRLECDECVEFVHDDEPTGAEHGNGR